MIEMSSRIGSPVEGARYSGQNILPSEEVRVELAGAFSAEPPYDWATQESDYTTERTLDEVLASPEVGVGDSIAENPDHPILSMRLNDTFTRIKRNYEERADNALALSIANASLRKRPALPPLDKDRFFHPDFGIDTSKETRAARTARAVVQVYNAMPNFLEGMIDEAVAIRNGKPSGMRHFR